LNNPPQVDNLPHKGFWKVSAPLLLLALAATAAAQVTIDAGVIAGTVSDPQGKPVANAAIKVSGRTEESRITADDGTYRFPRLLPGVYRVQTEAPGFAPQASENVTVVVGETTFLNITLGVGQSRFSVTVSAQMPAVDFERAQQANVIGPDRIENLPVNQRNYLDFAILTPGVVSTATIADSADFRVLVAPTSGLGFAGSNGRGNNVSIDGMPINGATGNVRPALPQAAVQEFQVNRNSYSAEYGGASGGVINIVTKPGGNGLHGEVFGLLRDRAIEARNYFDPHKSGYTREQSGASLSGPLARDRTFFFATFERLDRHETVFVPILSDPGILNRLTPSQQQLATALTNSGIGALAQVGAIMQTVLTPSTNPAVPAVFNANSGTFPFTGTQNQASLRLDHKLNAKNYMFFRASITREDLANTKFGALSGLSNGNSTRWADQTFVLSDSTQFSPRWLGITRLSFARARFFILPNDPIGPEIIINGFGSFGRDYVYPFNQNEWYWEGRQTFSYTSQRHSLNFGVDVSPVRDSSDVETFFGGRFLFGDGIPLSTLLDAQSPGLSATLRQTLPALGQASLVPAVDAPITALQAYALGLPLAYLQGFGNKVYQAWRATESTFVQDSWRVDPNLTLNIGLRQDFDAPPDIRHVNYFSPRFGFAWSPFQGDTVIRGGYGIFRETVQLAIPFAQKELNRPDVTLMVVPITGVPGVINPLTNQPITSADIYQTLSAEGVLGRRQPQESDLARLGIPPGFRFPTGGGVQGDYTSPYTHQASLEVEHGFGRLAVGISGEYSRALHVWRDHDQNLIQVGTRPDGWPIFGQKNPNYLNYYVYESSGNASYVAMVLHATKRMSHHWSVDAHFTWSKALDDVTDFTLEYEAANQLDNRAEHGLSPFHQKYRFVGTAIFESPVASRKTFGGRLLSGWMFSPIASANSFRPFNVLTGTDNLGDGETTTHRPLGLGRDVGIGPNYFSVDERLSRPFSLGKERRVRGQVIAECFNVLNRTNFQAVNNIVGDVPLSALPHPIVGTRASPTTPLAYTAAYDPRQFQFGLKFSF